MFLNRIKIFMINIRLIDFFLLVEFEVDRHAFFFVHRLVHRWTIVFRQLNRMLSEQQLEYDDSKSINFHQ